MKLLSWFFILALSFALVGCGGGSGNSLPQSQRFGSVGVLLRWPGSGASTVPSLAQSIKVVVFNNAGFSTDEIINRPGDDQDIARTFANVPVGDIWVYCTAYPQADAKGTPLATGMQQKTISENTVASVTLDMTSTIDHLEILPFPGPVFVNKPVQLIASARDAQGALVLLDAQEITWISETPSLASVAKNEAGEAWVTGLAAGTAIIRATEATTKGTATIEFSVDDKGGIIIVFDQDNVDIAFAPSPRVVKLGGTLQLSALVTGSTNSQVLWQVLESDGGYIIPAEDHPEQATYQAPTIPGVFTIIASSIADRTKQAVMEIVVVGGGLSYDTTPAALWGNQGGLPSQFQGPVALAILNGDCVAVVDEGNHRVQRFTSAGTYLDRFGNPGTLAGEFSSPSGIVLDSADRMYVVDTENDRIQRFNDLGEYQTQWSTVRNGDGGHEYPSAIAQQRDRLYVTVVAENASRLDQYTLDGALISSWPTAVMGDAATSIPVGVAIDNVGNVLVLDAGTHNVKKFLPAGGYLDHWGGYGSAEGKFDSPQGICTDRYGDVYVADTRNHRVQKFSNTGIFVTAWGTYGSTPGAFIRPSGVAVDADAYVYVTDEGNNRVQVFAPER